jgi:hypothetical protein
LRNGTAPFLRLRAFAIEPVPPERIVPAGTVCQEIGIDAIVVQVNNRWSRIKIAAGRDIFALVTAQTNPASWRETIAPNDGAKAGPGPGKGGFRYES